MASQSPSAGGGAPFDSETVAQEVSRAYELIKKLQALLRLGPKGDAPSELAWIHFKGAMQALNVALSIMKPGQAPAEPLEPLPVQSGSSPSRGLHGSQRSGSPAAQKKANGPAKRKREDDRSWETTTPMPYDDGYQWRKYGEKKISASQFPRSYFRCTFKEEHGCPATKVVQQKDHGDPPLFSVIYQLEHTCRRTGSATSRDLLTPVPASPSGTPAASCHLPPTPRDCGDEVETITHVFCEADAACSPSKQAPTSPLFSVVSPVAAGPEEAMYSSGCGPTFMKPHGLDVDDQIMDVLSFEAYDVDLLWSMC